MPSVVLLKDDLQILVSRPNSQLAPGLVDGSQLLDRTGYVDSLQGWKDWALHLAQHIDALLLHTNGRDELIPRPFRYLLKSGVACIGHVESCVCEE